MRAMKRIRVLQERSQAECADEVGISVKFWGKIERGQSDPPLSIAREICWILDAEIDEVFPEGKV